jgi:mycothiol synthase
MSSLPDGYRLAPTGDAEAVAALMNACDPEDVTGERVTADDVRSSWGELGQDGSATFVLAADGTPAGYFEVFGRPERVLLDGYVHPDFQGRGLGRAIVRLGEERARAIGSPVNSGTLAVDAAARELFESEGWQLARAFFRMTIGLQGDERPPEPPSGLALRTYEPVDAERFHAALEDAFSDHWDFHPQPLEEFRRKAIEAEDFDPSLWWLVLDGEEVAAAMCCTPKRFEMGWINALGVRRDRRRRGLGELLLRTAFAEFARRGETRVGLGVDAENETGATRLYERVGMRVAFRVNVFRRDLR